MLGSETGARGETPVKTMVLFQKLYETKLTMKLSQSSARVSVLCRGQGLEPRVELGETVLRFGPILPHSPGDEQTVTLTNPCSFPVEIYNLEFDTNYLHEEKVSRTEKRNRKTQG